MQIQHESKRRTITAMKIKTASSRHQHNIIITKSTRLNVDILVDVTVASQKELSKATDCQLLL